MRNSCEVALSVLGGELGSARGMGWGDRDGGCALESNGLPLPFSLFRCLPLLPEMPEMLHLCRGGGKGGVEGGEARHGLVSTVIL